MNLKNIMKITGIILIFVILQSYFTNPESFSTIIGRWTGYFMTLIMAIFIAILLEPIEKYLKKGGKLFTLGSDAHNIKDYAYKFDEARKFLLTRNIKEIILFKDKIKMEKI